eukprot:576907-Rhodomonas_salina.1
MCGTDLAYAAIRLRVCCTDLVYAATIWYAMCGTDLAYAATSARNSCPASLPQGTVLPYPPTQLLQPEITYKKRVPGTNCAGKMVSCI